MGRSERQADILNLLKRLGQGNRDLSPLKELFWTELNYHRVNQPIPLRNWPDTAAAALAEKPLLFAAGGQDKTFHIIYIQFSSDRLKLRPERAIVSQFLREHPYALFVFSNSGMNEWHFVNVKIAKEQHSQENRDPKYRRFFRRISVLPGEGLRTAAERLSLIQLPESDLFPLQLQVLHDTAFDKEKVTEAFYEDYVNVLDTLDEAIHGFAQSETEKRARRDYGQLLLGRLMFLYFIQMKGWLGREGQTSVHEHIIQSDFEYLQRHYRQIRDRSTRRNASGFYEDFLQGLFFKTLNTPRHDRPASVTRKYGEIPFLNGGLFQRTPEEQSRIIAIPNEAFAPILDPEFIGDSGKQALFLNYNFTVREDDPLDVTVAVDPEMLSKAFERQVVGREIKGAFYTPGPVVDAMCRESLRNYFSEQTQVQTKKIDYILEQHGVGELTDKEAGLLFEAAQDIRICDPAVGSGAFLIGMLHRLVTLQEVIYDRFPALRQTIRKRIITGHTELPQVLAEELDETTLRYFLKRYVIQHNLYGVDIERFAVQIAQLRLWLSLTVDLEAKYIAHIPPLPNLDLNLRVGNSLIATYHGIDFELETGAQAKHFVPVLAGLDSLRSQYYEETREDGKERLRGAIE